MRTLIYMVLLLALLAPAQAETYERYKLTLENYKQRLENVIAELVPLTVEVEELEKEWIPLLLEHGREQPSPEQLESLLEKMPPEIGLPGPVPEESTPKMAAGEKDEIDKLRLQIRQLESYIPKVDQRAKHVKWLRRQIAELKK